MTDTEREKVWKQLWLFMPIKESNAVECRAVYRHILPRQPNKTLCNSILYEQVENKMLCKTRHTPPRFYRNPDRKQYVDKTPEGLSLKSDLVVSTASGSQTDVADDGIDMVSAAFMAKCRLSQAATETKAVETKCAHKSCNKTFVSDKTRGFGEFCSPACHFAAYQLVVVATTAGAKVAASATTSEARKRIHLAIDLGGQHPTLQAELVPFLDCKQLSVSAFADYAYPASKYPWDKRVGFWQNSRMERDLTDLKLITETFCLAREAKSRGEHWTFVILTADKTIATASHLLQDEGHECRVMRSWCCDLQVLLKSCM